MRISFPSEETSMLCTYQRPVILKYLGRIKLFTNRSSHHIVIYVTSVLGKSWPELLRLVFSYTYVNRFLKL